MFLFRVTGMGGVLSPNVSVVLPPPTPIAINSVQSTTLDRMDSPTKHIPYIAPVISNRPDKILLTNEQLDEFSQISSEFRDDLISMEEAILKLRGGGRFNAICWLVLYSWLLEMQHQAEGLENIRPPHQEWMPKGRSQRPPYAGGYGSSNSGSRLGLTHTNDGFNKLSRTAIQNAYNQIPSLSIEGTDYEVTAWSAAKHIHHSVDFGMDPRKYGMTQEDLNNISRKGLINHIRAGGTTPSEEYVKAFQLRWKSFAERSDVRQCGIETVMGEQCYVVQHAPTRIFLAFKVNSGESYTGYRLTLKQYANHNQNHTIGKTYKN